MADASSETISEKAKPDTRSRNLFHIMVPLGILIGVAGAVTAGAVLLHRSPGASRTSSAAGVPSESEAPVASPTGKYLPDLIEARTKAETQLNSAQQTDDVLARKYPCFQVTGRVEKQEEDRILLWGLSLSNNIQPGQVGLATDKTFLLIVNYDKSSVIGGVGGSYTGSHWYIGSNDRGVMTYSNAPEELAKADETLSAAKKACELLDSQIDVYRTSFAALVSDVQSKIDACTTQLNPQYPTLPDQIVSRDDFIAYLNTIEKATTDWKSGFKPLDEALSASMSKDRLDNVPMLTKAFPEIGERWNHIQDAVKAYAKRRELIAGNDFDGVIKKNIDLVSAIKGSVVTSEDLVQFGSAVHDSIAASKKTGDDAGRILPVYTIWLQSVCADFVSNPKWSMANAPEVNHVRDVLSMDTANVEMTSAYNGIIDKLERDLDARQKKAEDDRGDSEVSKISGTLATINPWTTTRALGLSDPDRTYHRTLILRFDANAKTSDILGMKSIIAEEGQKHPEMWSHANVMATYSGLQKSQFLAYLSKKSQEGVVSDDDVSAVDVVFSGGALLSAGDFLSSANVISFLTLIDIQKNPAATRSPLALDVATVIGGASLDLALMWHHGKLLIVANKNAKANDVLNIDTMVKKDVAAYPAMWNDDIKGLWQTIQVKQFLTYGSSPKFVVEKLLV